MMRSRAGVEIVRRGLGRACATAVLVLAAVAAAPAPVDHGAAAAGVVVDANRFDPFKVELEPGGTVTWEVRQAGHTIVADDGRFGFFGADGGTIPVGETRSFTVGQAEEVIRYHCSIHGLGMAGAIVVGHPKPVVDDPTVIAVPGDGPEPMTIEGAVAAAEPGTRIEIAPGRYTVSEQVEVDLRDGGELPHGLTIVGMGNDPSDVIVEVALVPQRGAADAVFHVTGAFVTVRNLTVEASAVSSTGTGIHLDGADQAAMSDVVVDGRGWARDGLRITDAAGAGLRGVVVRDVRRAGVRVEPCAACGVLVEDAELSGGLVGVLAAGARGVVVRDSTIYDNAAGVIAHHQDGRLSTVQVYGNRIVGNVVRERLPAATDPERRLATGAGVWLDGATDSLVAGNTIAGNSFGVAVSGGARGVTVSTNTLTGNGTDLAWDGLGIDTCFTGHDPDVSTAPALLAELYPCDRPTVGVPYPLVNVALLSAAYT